MTVAPAAARIAVALATAWLATAWRTPAAQATPIVIGPAALALDDGWATPPTVDGPVVATRGDARLTVVRYDVPNLEAWRDRTRDAHVEAIVAGVAATPGYKLLTRATSRVGKAAVPTLELVFRRRGPAGNEVVAMRALLFRTTTIVVVAASPDDRSLVEQAARALAPTR